ncbi:MAG: rhomboid family intramembrane serine protease [Candidatus Lokiarchaeota archaeon]|nr:rhomboid family intramembrane serine protease [Candidatus Lokiarchaeota archaeon]
MNSKIKINDYITVCLEHNKILIYIQGERFQELEYSFLNKILNASENQKEETKTQGKITENIFKNDSKNNYFNIFANILKFWIRNNYDTGILLYNFSFPLLKKLVEVGDPQAKKVFINEILKNLWGADPLVVKYLIKEKYDNYVAMYNNRRNIHTPNIKGIKLTIYVCILNIFIYILFTEVFHIEDIFNFDLHKILNNFEVWRIFTSIFIHPGRFSLLINTFFLSSVGSYFEANNLLSKHVYFIVYLLSGIMGNIGYMLISSELPYFLSSAGASGAIFGLAGAFIIILLIKEKYYWAIIYSAICVFFYFYTIIPRINYISHLFGFIAGIIIYVFCIFIYQYVIASDRFLV